ncbi:hypothetical protein B0J14DRAFT_571088 [Halenospora varia]|nr:hypothetical protein B0J14DRAFT_571088 [Halenospora varia]
MYQSVGLGGGLCSLKIYCIGERYQVLEVSMNSQEITKYPSAIAGWSPPVSKLLPRFTSIPLLFMKLDSESAFFLATNACAVWLADFEKKLPPLSQEGSARRLFHRLKLPLDEEDRRQAAEALHRFVQIFNLALNVQGFQILSKTQAEAIDYIQDRINQNEAAHSQQWRFSSDQLKEVKRQLRILPDILANLEDIKHKLDIVNDGTEFLIVGSLSPLRHEFSWRCLLICGERGTIREIYEFNSHSQLP